MKKLTFEINNIYVVEAIDIDDAKHPIKKYILALDANAPINDFQYCLDSGEITAREATKQEFIYWASTGQNPADYSGFETFLKKISN